EQRRSYQQQFEQQEISIVQLDRDAYQQQLSFREQRLQLQVQRAQLTTNTIADDRKAQAALVSFYEAEAKDAKLTAAQRLQYRSEAIQARIQLKQLTGAGLGASVADIFGEAASEFRSYGSNIAGRGGILSGQDARARFAARVLSQSSSQQLAA